MYLTYEEYQNMGGTLDETTFNDFEFEAETYIDWYTFNRLSKFEELPEAVKKCMYRIILLAKARFDMLMTSTPTGSSTLGLEASLTSQSNDGVSLTYNTISATYVFGHIKNEMEDIVNRYLCGLKDSLGHGLLYRGVYPDE